MPTVREPDEPLDVRTTNLVVELFRLYDRTGHLYRVYQKSPTHPALLRTAAWWDENVTSMLARGLGDRASDEEAMKVISVLTNPGFRSTLIMTGIDQSGRRNRRRNGHRLARGLTAPRIDRRTPVLREPRCAGAGRAI